MIVNFNVIVLFTKITVENLLEYVRRIPESQPGDVTFNYSQIHPALQLISPHSTLELCLWWLAFDRDITSHVEAS